METLFKGRRTLSVMPTYTCPAACSNCGTLSSPKEKTNLDIDSIKSATSQAKDLGFYNVVFTGGEATLRWKDLLECIRFATDLGFPTRVVSNAHWAHSPDYAETRLQALIEAGLSEINYSTGDEHVRFVPFERVIYAAAAAAQLNLPVHIMVEYKKQRTVTKDDIYNHPLITSLPGDVRKMIRAIESPWMPLNPLVYEQYDDQNVANNDNLAMKDGCDNILQTYTIQADGNVASCCGLGMRLIPELQVSTVAEENFLEKAVEEAENDFLKLWVHYMGPEKILAWAASKDPSVKWENLYAHRCQACQRIYKDEKIIRLIRLHHEEVMADVLHSIWIDEEYFPNRIKEMQYQFY
jgi:organic radical activating enzyme